MKRLPFLLLGILAACGTDRTAGTGSQTGNSVMAGRLLAADSTALSHEVVSLLPATWTADSSLSQIRTDTTDSAGRYRFEGVPSGIWRLDARERNTGWIRTLPIRAATDSTLPTFALRRNGYLKIEVMLDDSMRGGRVEIYGTTEKCPMPLVGLEWEYDMGALPPGLHTLAMIGRSGRVLREAGIRIIPDSTLVLDDIDWHDSIIGPHIDDEAAEHR